MVLVKGDESLLSSDVPQKATADLLSKSLFPAAPASRSSSVNETLRTALTALTTGAPAVPGAPA